MAVSPRTLRITFVVLAALLLVTVAGFYFYARHRVRTAVRQIPKKLGVEIQQTAQGFSFCKSDHERTIFCVRAAKTIQFKTGQHAELNDVTIIVYGKQGNRFDQIYGARFEYDPQAQMVRALGDVSIDLEGDTSQTAASRPDQAPPQELKNPIHLKTSGLVFNQKTGIAETHELIEFRTPQAHGTARGARYDSNDGTLDIASDIHIFATEAAGGNPQIQRVAGGEITAQHGMITKDPLAATLDGVHGQRAGATFAADRVRMLFHEDATLISANASGHVAARREGAAPAEFHGGQVDLAFAPKNELRTAVLTGHPTYDAKGPKLVHGEASRAEITFAAENQVRHVHAVENVKLTQRSAASGVAVAQTKSPPKPKSGLDGAPGSVLAQTAPQSLELTAQTLDVDLRNGRTIEKAWTTGGSVLSLPQGNLEAPRLDATFTANNRPQTLHASGGARLHDQQRTTSSRELQAGFGSDGRISTLEQTGDFFYEEGSRRATAERAHYTAADEMFTLTGNARYTDGSSQLSIPDSQAGRPGHARTEGNTDSGDGADKPNGGSTVVSANVLRLNRRTGDVNAQGEVKATYTEAKPSGASGGAASNGALFGGSSPVHATGATMTASRQSGQARFSGGARLWQDANIVEAPTIEFDRTRRTMLARAPSAGAANAPRVTTSFVQKDKQGKLTPVTITSAQLAYSDQDRQAHFTGGVVMRGADATVWADRADVVLAPRNASNTASGNAPSQLQQVTAEGHVKLEEPRRRASGEKLVYTDADGKFVLTGGPPSIFDAEKGNLTGNSLTFFSRDDTVVVEGGTGRALTTQRTTR